MGLGDDVQTAFMQGFEKATGLKAEILGLQPGDVVCIIGDNEPEWFWGEFATQAAGGVATGIFVDSIPSEVQYVAEHSDARFIIANDQEQTDKILEIKEQLPMHKLIEMKINLSTFQKTVPSFAPFERPPVLKENHGIVLDVRPNGGGSHAR
jgi:long-subunit acyl-CoA synthetase (AMP-forming)